MRRDFPILDNKAIIYFDSACVSLKPKQVIEAMNRYYNEFPACAGRSAHKLGDKVTQEVHNSRKTIQKFIGAKESSEVIFTKNTTEGLNLVANTFQLQKGDVVLTSDKEHNSGLLPFQLMKNRGIQHKVFKFGDLDDFQEKLQGVKLVSTVHTSNLDGTSNPIKEMAKLAHDNKSVIMVDGAQSVPHKEIDVRKLDIDFLAFSGHKMLGPSGTGVLYGKKEYLENLNPIVLGGETVTNSTYDSYDLADLPDRFEPGLQNYAGIMGLAAAAKYLQKIGMKKIQEHELKLNKKISKGFGSLGIDILGGDNRGGIVSFNIKGVQPHEIAGMLNSANIMIRSGMHCVHSWFNAHNLKGSARASLYLYNTLEECDIFLEEIKKIKNLTS